MRVPEWNDPYINDFQAASSDVKDFYRELRKKWNKGIYVEISEYEGHNSSYYYYYIWEQIDKPFF